MTNQEMPIALEQVSGLLSLETHQIQVARRERQARGREKQRFGQVHVVENERIEEAISNIIHELMRNHYGAAYKAIPFVETPLILAGFSLDFEFQTLSRQYPKVLEHFTSWLDLQHVMRDVARDSAPKVTSPSLHETLLACGFEDGVGGCRSISSRHKAANETVREAAIFTYFLAWHRKGEGLDISVLSRRKNNKLRSYYGITMFPEQKKLWNRKRPNPKQFFPYGARVYRTGSSLNFDVQYLFNLFAAYEPVAAGISAGKHYGWVCLFDMEALNKFLQHFDGSTFSDGYVWRAVSDFDPKIVPAYNRDEFKSREKLQLQEVTEEKRAQRRAKREAEDVWAML